ncbi:MarR family winged helix-turn-helix transcriptional regulator [Aureimonas leprariae]|uniref:MarR family transcriptional regulator n=1 Tax=Plantimonas leprariae TaxID=2615207 RepID=A0A7V7PSL3_9HYPH|nr:MarR family transcriptional regulator [Aureimonas leprariae]KAB0682058.1 MarR family transcriptional regulator [Aureimonas leprariae]
MSHVQTASTSHVASAPQRDAASRHEAVDDVLSLVPHLLSIAKSVRQLVGIKLAGTEVLVGQDAMLLLFDGDEALPVSEVACRLSVRPSTVSKMADRLVAKGWLVRQTGPDDARQTLVRLTGDGRRVSDEVRALEASLDAELATALGADRSMIKTLAQLDAVLAKRLSRLR